MSYATIDQITVTLLYTEKLAINNKLSYHNR
jgi:hypothetical protein